MNIRKILTLMCVSTFTFVQAQNANQPEVETKNAKIEIYCSNDNEMGAMVWSEDGSHMDCEKSEHQMMFVGTLPPASLNSPKAHQLFTNYMKKTYGNKEYIIKKLVFSESGEKQECEVSYEVPSKKIKDKKTFDLTE